MRRAAEAEAAAAASVLLGHLLQRVPLRDGSSGVGQHVAPVPQLGARRIATEHDASDGLRRADAVVVDHRDDQTHFLWTQKQHELASHVRRVPPSSLNFSGRNRIEFENATWHSR